MKIIDYLAAKFGYQRKPRFPQAGVGSGIIFYCRDPNTPWQLLVSCAQRSAKVGVGWGIGCGGWVDLQSLLGYHEYGVINRSNNLSPLVNMRLQAVIRDEDSAIREGTEEIPGLFTVLPEETLRERLFYLTGFSVYVPDDPHGNFFHHALYFACPVTPGEMEALKALPKSDETAAPLAFFEMRWMNNGALKEPLTGLPEPFHHAHEIHAFRWLAHNADRNRLPYLKE